MKIKYGLLKKVWKNFYKSVSPLNNYHRFNKQYDVPAEYWVLVTITYHLLALGCTRSESLTIFFNIHGEAISYFDQYSVNMTTFPILLSHNVN